MLVQLQTVKARLLISDNTDDTLLTNFIEQAGALFDKFCNRTFARAEAATQEFRGDEVEIAVARFPIEVIIGFDLKSNENESWLPVTAPPDYLVRGDCVIALRAALGNAWDQARILYAGGYVLPGTTPDTGQTALPKDIEQAAVEQVAHWYRTRNLQGVTNTSGNQASIALNQDTLLPVVQATLEPYRRIQL